MPTPSIARCAALGILLMTLSASTLASSGLVQTQEIRYRAGDVELVGTLALPANPSGRGPAVIVVHEWWGKIHHPVDEAIRLAHEGYVAFALDMYGDARTTTETAQAAEWAGEIRNNPKLMQERFEAALKVLKRQPNVDPKRIAAIGYCFGGGIVLEMARANVELAGVASFHGSLKSSWAQPASEIKPRILVLHGADDPLVPAEDISAFQSEMRAAAADWQFIAYGNAVHSFTNPAADRAGIEGVAYDAKAATRSFRALLTFLEETFNTAGGVTGLQQQLDGMKHQFVQSAPPSLVNLFRDGGMQVRDAGIGKTAPQVGQPAPLFELPDARGRVVKLESLLKRGPVVLVWYRGGWCPYCNVTLRAYQQRLDEIRDLGASFVAISPELPDYTASTQSQNQLAYPVLSDKGNAVAKRYDIAFELAPQIVERFKGSFELSRFNGDNDNLLPHPATFVIDRQGIVRFAHFDPDYTLRAEPQDVIGVLKTLAQPTSAAR